MDPQVNLYALQERLAEQIDAGMLEVYLCLHDLASGRMIEINGQRRFYPASLIKLLLLLVVLEQLERGRLSLDDTHTLSEADLYAGSTLVTGSGVLQFAKTGTCFTLAELLAKMISISDNVATNILYQAVGARRINAAARRLGLRNTAFTRRMYELDSPLPSNVSTACDLTRLLTALYAGQAAGQKMSAFGIELMRAAVDKERIGRYIRHTVDVANKVGTVSGIVGDAALLFFPRRPPAALTIVVKDPPEQENAARLIGKLAALAAQTLQEAGP
ncbi:MAG: serine hydrolase [Bacillota bacterium]